MLLPHTLKLLLTQAVNIQLYLHTLPFLLYWRATSLPWWYSINATSLIFLLDPQQLITVDMIELSTFFTWLTSLDCKHLKDPSHILTPLGKPGSCQCKAARRCSTSLINMVFKKPYKLTLKYPYNIIRWKWKWSHSVVSDCLRPHGLEPTRLLCPSDFPGNSTGVDCHFLLQGIFPTQGSNPGLPHCRQMLTVWATREVNFIVWNCFILWS